MNLEHGKIKFVNWLIEKNIEIENKRDHLLIGNLWSGGWMAHTFPCLPFFLAVDKT